jgi:hypothetical protein
MPLALVRRFGASGLGCRVSGFGFRVSGLGCRVSGFGLRVYEGACPWRWCADLGVGIRELGVGGCGLGFGV